MQPAQGNRPSRCCSPRPTYGRQRRRCRSGATTIRTGLPPHDQLRVRSHDTDCVHEGCARCRLPDVRSNGSAELQAGDAKGPCVRFAIGTLCADQGAPGTYDFSRLSSGARLGPARPDRADQPDQDSASEQVALGHRGIETGHVSLRLNPAQNEHVPDGRSLLIHGAVFLNAGAHP
jgi:hypothetical protein